MMAGVTGGSSNAENIMSPNISFDDTIHNYFAHVPGIVAESAVHLQRYFQL